MPLRDIKRTKVRQAAIVATFNSPYRKIKNQKSESRNEFCLMWVRHKSPMGNIKEGSPPFILRFDLYHAIAKSKNRKVSM